MKDKIVKILGISLVIVFVGIYVVVIKHRDRGIDNRDKPELERFEAQIEIEEANIKAHVEAAQERMDLDGAIFIDEIELENYIFNTNKPSYTREQWKEIIRPYLYDKLVEYKGLYELNGKAKYEHRIETILARVTRSRARHVEEFLEVSRELIYSESPILRASAGLLLLKKGTIEDRILCRDLVDDESEWVRSQISLRFRKEER